MASYEHSGHPQDHGPEPSDVPEEWDTEANWGYGDMPGVTAQNPTNPDARDANDDQPPPDGCGDTGPYLDSLEEPDYSEEDPRGNALRRICEHVAASGDRISQALTLGLADHPDGPATVKGIIDDGSDPDTALDVASYVTPVGESHTVHTTAMEAELAATAWEHGEDLRYTGLAVESGLRNTRLRVDNAAAFADTLEQMRSQASTYTVTATIQDVLEQAVVDIRIGVVGLYPEEAAAYCPCLPGLNPTDDEASAPMDTMYLPNVPMDLPPHAGRIADQLDGLQVSSPLSNALRLMGHANNSGALVPYAALADLRAISPTGGFIGVDRLKNPDDWNNVLQVLENMDIQGIDPAFTRACCESILRDIDQTIAETEPNPHRIQFRTDLEADERRTFIQREATPMLRPVRDQINRILEAHQPPA